jgi:undecaprenyl diphosphate synthase
MPHFSSSTRDIPQVKEIPRHIAIIMDGNGRWAKQRMLPRAAGHKRGVEIVREVVKACAARNVEYLTLFAFSSENWRRPAEEVSMLKQLFILALEREAEKLHRNGIRLRVVGDIAPFGKRITELARARRS